MKRIILALVSFLLVFVVRADQDNYLPEAFHSGSSLTIDSGVPLKGTWVFDVGSTLDITSATKIGFPSGVTSVFGRTGVVTASSTDYASFYSPLASKVPTGGSTNQSLMKNSTADYDMKWGNPSVTINLNGAVTGSGASGSVGITTSIAPNAVTYGALQAASGTKKLLGAAGTTAFGEIGLGTGLDISGGNLVITGGGGGTPGGSDKQVQFNLAGTFSGIAGLTFDAGIPLLTMQVGNFTQFVDPTRPTTRMMIQLGHVTLGALRNLNQPDADTTSVVGSAAPSNQFATGIDAVTGVVSYAQPAFTNLSGAATTAQAGIPTGGTGNQALLKNSATNYDVGWGAVGNVSKSGTPTSGQIAQWASASTIAGISAVPTTSAGLPTGGSANQILSKIDGTNYNTQWVTPNPTATPGGSNTQLQYNNSGVFGGIPGATYDGTNLKLSGGVLQIFDPITPTKNFSFVTSNIAAGTPATPNIAPGSSTTVVGSTAASHQFANSVNATTGTIGYAQPAFTDISGVASTTQGAIPTGGTANQILSKINSTDFNTQWVTPASGGNVSNVGTPTNGQLAQWTTATTIQGVSSVPTTEGGLPTGGTTNQVLSKVNATDYNTQWVTPASASPGGSNTQVQFNDSGAFNGDSGLTINKTTHVVTAPTTLNAGGDNGQIDSNGLSMGGTVGINFSGSSSAAATSSAFDLRLGRWAAGQLGVVNSVGQPGSIFEGVTDLTTNAASNALQMSHELTSGTPAPNFGVTQQFMLNTTTSSDVAAVNVTGAWATATHASRNAYMDWALATGGANPASAMRLYGGGGLHVGTSPSDPTSGWVDAVNGYKIGGTDEKSAILTWSNKRITKRVVPITVSATPAINTDSTDVATITSQNTDITSMTSGLTGTPNEGDALLIKITDNGTARAITWGAKFGALQGTSLPSTTIVSHIIFATFYWDSINSLWIMTGQGTF